MERRISPSKTAREESIPAIELEKACSESWIRSGAESDFVQRKGKGYIDLIPHIIICHAVRIACRQEDPNQSSPQVTPAGWLL